MGYSKKVRAVPAHLKKQAYARYGITPWEPDDYPDLAVPTRSGTFGRNRPWNAHVKDVLERRLHNLVCSGQVDLKTVQHEIATGRIKAYQEIHAGEDRLGLLLSKADQSKLASTILSANSS